MTKCIKCKEKLHNKQRCCDLIYEYHANHVIIRDELSRPERVTRIGRGL